MVALGLNFIISTKNYLVLHIFGTFGSYTQLTTSPMCLQCFHYRVLSHAKNDQCAQKLLTRRITTPDDMNEILKKRHNTRRQRNDCASQVDTIFCKSLVIYFTNCNKILKCVRTPSASICPFRDKKRAEVGFEFER